MTRKCVHTLLSSKNSFLYILLIFINTSKKSFGEDQHHFVACTLSTYSGCDTLLLKSKSLSLFSRCICFSSKQIRLQTSLLAPQELVISVRTNLITQSGSTSQRTSLPHLHNFMKRQTENFPLNSAVIHLIMCIQCCGS